MTAQPMPPVAANLGEITDLVLAARPTLGTARLVLIDGPAGSGKTTLAGRLAVALGGPPAAQLLHADDMYEGWGGLPTLSGVLVDQVLEPTARGEVGAFRAWDWHRNERTRTVEVLSPSVLIVEGVGVGMRRARAWASLLVWVEADPAERLRRGLERDGERLREEWLRWQMAEQDEFEQEGTRAAAAIRVDGDRELAP